MTLPPIPEPHIRIRLLGGCEFQRAQRLVRLESVKTSALLAYLVLQAEAQSRHKLMGLFWGDLPEEHARRNLRHALWNLRRQFASSDLPPLLLTDSQTVQFNRAAPVWLDVAEFKQCLQREAEWSDAAKPDHRPALLREAMDLYRGDLLDGLYVDDAPAFDEWLLVERERLRALAIETLHRLVMYHLDWGEYADGLEYARRLLAMEPWREDAHRQMMRLLALGGQRAAALAQYETCRRLLAEELRVEPSPETQALYESILAGQNTGQARPPKPASHLPMQATPFVGRETERAEIAALVYKPDCRLLTLVGPGGIGKTRLAVRVAAEIEGFNDGVFFVPLVGVNSADLVVHALAIALNFTFRGGEEARIQLLDFLRDKEMLLLLDNFEHLLDAAGLLNEIIAAAPQVKFLITSRERLNISPEWVFQVEGLDYPSRSHPPPLQEQSERIELESYSAVQLFVQSAQRARFGFVLEEEDKPRVARLCQLVEGMPLAVELAAAWTRVLSCQEIAEEVERGLDLLATSQRDLPARHRSMRAVFEHSWQLLSENERAVFKRLAVFRGGFTREAAQAVLGDQSTVNAGHSSLNALYYLTTLVDKCFVRHTASRRYEIHELLRQYGEDQMSHDEKAQAAALHCQYFADFLQQREEALHLRGPKHVLDEITEEIENIRVAWDEAIANRRVAEINKGLNCLRFFYDARGLFHEGETTFRRAIEKLGGVERMFERPATPISILIIRLVARQSWLCFRLGLYEQGKELARQSLAAALQLGIQPEAAVSLGTLTTIAIIQGNYAQAEQMTRQCLAIYEAQGDRPGIAIMFQRFGDLARLRGNYAEAKQFLLESCAVCREIGFELGLAWSLYSLGQVSYELKEYAEARRYGAEALAFFEAVDNPYGIASALCILGKAAYGLEEYREAKTLFDRSLGISVRVHAQSMVIWILSWLAMLFAKEGKTERGLELAMFVSRHPAGDPEIQNRAASLISELKLQLTPQALATTIQKANAAQLADYLSF